MTEMGALDVDENRNEKEDEDNKKNNKENKVEVRFTESRR